MSEILADILKPGCEAFVQPQIVPPGRRHNVAELQVEILTFRNKLIKLTVLLLTH